MFGFGGLGELSLLQSMSQLYDPCFLLPQSHQKINYLCTLDILKELKGA